MFGKGMRNMKRKSDRSQEEEDINPPKKINEDDLQTDVDLKEESVAVIKDKSNKAEIDESWSNILSQVRLIADQNNQIRQTNRKFRKEYEEYKVWFTRVRSRLHAVRRKAIYPYQIILLQNLDTTLSKLNELPELISSTKTLLAEQCDKVDTMVFSTNILIEERRGQWCCTHLTEDMKKIAEDLLKILDAVDKDKFRMETVKYYLKEINQIITVNPAEGG